MARKSKLILSINQSLDRRELGYYSTPNFVAKYIYQRLLEINPKGLSVLDTCVGNEELLQPFFETNIACTGIDIFQHKENYKCNFIHNNFLDCYESFITLNDKSLSNYDFLIANPPYNCHELEYISNNKKKLQNLFPKIGVHNMYSMFMAAMIDMAKEGAVLGFIIHDSFLTSKSHYELRLKILENCVIHDIILAPIDLFHSQKADVRTAIVILEKTKIKNQMSINLQNRSKNTIDFEKKLLKNQKNQVDFSNFILKNQKDNFEFITDISPSIIDLFKHKRINDLFNCVTGISTGNDKKYLSPVPTPDKSIPFFKNPGNKKFFCIENAYLINHFLEERKNIKNFMVRNIPLMGKDGITCSSMGVEFSACYLPKNSTFGVNPTIFCPNEDDIWWLLAYLNSDLVKYFIRGILIRTNMVTSGYVSRVPVLPFEDHDKIMLKKYAKKAYEKAKNNESISTEINQINELVFKNSKLDKNDIFEITDFCKDIIRRT